ncbi:MAG: HAMP domain-containing sensor histidine kinase, partial [Verrucomicrobiota bacterium]
ARLFGALIGAAVLAALAGLLTARRAFYQQHRLGEMKTNFVSSVSHELRAPIASMRLLAESLERGKIPETARQQEYYRFLVQESRRLTSLIENVLDFSRIEQGRKEYQFEPADLDALAAETVQSMVPAAVEKQVELAWLPGPGPGPLPSCDGLALQQALINLIDNAIKHSPAGARVTVGREDAAPNLIHLWVEDHGPGIPPDEHEKIFERFYRRGSELRRETQGVGIGLTIVKHIIEAHGGRVLVRSAVGQGSRFTLELPMNPPEQPK